MMKVSKTTVKLCISLLFSAKAFADWNDVTPTVQKLLTPSIYVSTDTMGGDPANGILKTLQITVKDTNGNIIRTVNIPEGKSETVVMTGADISKTTARFGADTPAAASSGGSAR